MHNKFINIDDIYRLIEGHSNYHGDDILSAFTCLSEGKTVTNIRILEERPQGKWISVDEFMFDWQCSKCQCGIKGSKTSFCPHCGADMRGGKE